MNRKTIKFPQYRKMINDKAFYKISHEREFTEIQMIGKSAKIHIIKAEKYPEILRIQDMINLENEWIVEMQPEDFEALLSNHDV